MTNLEDDSDNIGSAFFERVPVVTVHKENIDQVWETLVSDIQVFIIYVWQFVTAFNDDFQL